MTVINNSNIQAENKKGILIAYNSDIIMILKEGDYRKLQENRDIFAKFCNRHGLYVSVFEVDNDDIELFKNNTKELEKRYSYLMESSGDEVYD